MLSKTPTHTLWARCSERRGYCYRRVSKDGNLRKKSGGEREMSGLWSGSSG
jgi:hypothetical protein